MHLVDHARAHIDKTYRRPLLDRIFRAILAAVLPYPERFRAALGLAKLGRPFAPLLQRIPALKPLAAMLALAPRSLPEKKAPPAVRPEGTRRGRVAILAGCAQSVLDPGINEATARLLSRLGIEIIAAPGEGCCGALVHHMGREADALDFARNNIDAWIQAIDQGGLDAILITASGCGTTIKDYGFMLRLDPAYAGKAARVSALAKDISVYLGSLDIPDTSSAPGLAVAYHSACSMQHGQKITRQPKDLLKKAGFVVKEPREGHLCCGSAGTYNIMQPEISGKLKARKVRNIEATRADVIATGNIGCITQIATGTEMPILHTVELLDWAYGGPKPARLLA
jgi:glycolate oxidase iron-sulfur subunit